MANWYVSSVKHAAIAQWAASSAVVLGQYCRQLASVPDANGRVFKCTTAGTTGGTEPTWNLSNNATTNDGTAVWTQVGGQEAEQLAGDWKAALPRMGCLNSLGSLGDIAYVANDHAESAAIGKTISNQIQYICVNPAGSLPPAEADITVGAVLETTGNNTISITGGTSVQGVKFKCGTGSSSATHISLSGNSYLEDCELELASTSISAGIQLGSSSTGQGFSEWVNTKVTFQNTSQRVEGAFVELLWRDTAVPFGGSVPTTFLGVLSTNGSRFLATCRNLDLSSLTGNLASTGTAQLITFENCKLNATTTFPTSAAQRGNLGTVRMHDCDDNASNIGFNFKERGNNVLNEAEASIFRAGGASDGANSFSIKVTMPNNGQYFANKPYIMKIGKRYNTLNTPKTFTLHALIDAASLPARANLYCDFYVQDTANTPAATKHSTRTSILDTNTPQTTTENWVGTLPARTNSTLRTSGYLFQVASNPNRVFKVTATGTSAASEPAAYSTAVDGDTFADGTSTVRVMRRIKFEITATPRRRGMVWAVTRYYGSNGSLLWIDPKIEVA